MELTQIPDLGPNYAQMLRDAGVGSVAALAAVTDLDSLAERTRIHVATLDAFRHAAREAMEKSLGEAGVANPHDLANADLDALAQKSGIDREALAHYQRAARGSLGMSVAESPAALPDRLVLREGSAKGVIHLAGETHVGVPLVLVRVADDDEDALRRAGELAVVLKEKATTAPARVAGRTVGALPIYQAREDGSEFRVRVAGLKEKPVTPTPEAPQKPAGGRLFQRFLGKKSP